MRNLKKSHLALIILSVLILLGCIGMTAYLLFSNYQNVRLFRQAQKNCLRGDPESIAAAEAQLQQVIRIDSDHEAAYVMLGELTGKRKIYPEQVYYCFMAHRLNPLSSENRERYINSLWSARYFDRLENFLSRQEELADEAGGLLLYSAGRNGSFGKYKKLLAKQAGKTPAGRLALLLFDRNNSGAEKILESLKDEFDDPRIKQEILAARAELYLEIGDIANAEKALCEAYALNPYAFAPALGRFYANYRSIGKALPIFEAHLATYHDPVVALQTAEFYCLVKRPEKIRELRRQYQSDSGKRAMLFCYYFDALIAFAGNDTASLKELLLPLRNSIDTPLARYIFFCADLREKNLSAITEGYRTLLASDNYPDLQRRADDMLSDFLRSSFPEFRNREEQLLAAATLLYSRKKEAFTAKFILLAQKRRNAVNLILLQDALKRFGQDQGVVKIAIEYFLHNDPAECERLIALFKQRFSGRAADMQRYEIILALKKRDLDRASALFRKAFAPDILPEYWNFAHTTMREQDLIFLSRDKTYAPFCRALLLLKQGKPAEACDLLEKQSIKENLPLLFFAAGTLAENGRLRAALDKYAQFPPDSTYQLDVLLNTAEIHAESGNLERALELSAKAYSIAPDLLEAQLCHADKLYRRGILTRIPEVIRPSKSHPLRKRIEFLWVAGVQQKIRECESSRQWEKARELCRQLLQVSPGNRVAQECIRKLNQMRQ